MACVFIDKTIEYQPFGGDLASTDLLKLKMHVEDEAYLVNHALIVITGNLKGRKAANNARLNRVALAA